MPQNPDVNTISDARNLIERLLPLVTTAEKQFKSARNWGVVDLLGGGLLTDLIKHSYINSAGNTMNEISRLLGILQQTLKTLVIPVDYRMNCNGFATFADFVFDGVLADAWMESKILSSLDEVRQLKERLYMVQRTLSQM